MSTIWKHLSKPLKEPPMATLYFLLLPPAGFIGITSDRMIDGEGGGGITQRLHI